MTTYAQVQQQIAKLQKQADAIRAKELSDVVARIKEAITAYGLTASDLGLGASATVGRRAAKTPRRAAAAPKRATKVAKYRDDSGNAWGGRGPRPRWIKEALAAGKSLDDFRA